jgi:hypothetical protein
MIRETLIQEILANTERVLALLNKNPLDKLCGSFDREYWAWNFKDYPNMSLQTGVYLLALLWDTEFEGNRCYRDDSILIAIRKALSFWIRGQKKNGSFDQCYYNEQSYGTTSYTLLAVLNTLRLIEEKLPVAELENIRQAVGRASDFLLRNAEKYGAIANHQAQFMYAMLLIDRYRNQPACREEAYARLSSALAALQSEEGWFQEYDGMDVGYLSQTIYYLARCHELTGEEGLLDQIRWALRFFVHFIHPDGSCGGVYGSRYNENFYPCGFALLKNQIPIAGRVLAHCLSPVNPNVKLATLDSENLIRIMTNYIETLRCEHIDTPTDDELLPCEKPETDILFSKAGVHVKGTRYYYAIMAIKKGGCLSIYDKIRREPLHIDPSYVVVLSNGVRISHGIRQDAEYKVTGNQAFLRARFARVRIPEYTPFKGFVLRLLAFTLLRSPVVNDWLKKILVHMLITGETAFPAILERSVTFHDDRVEILDEISLQEDHAILDIIEDPDIRTRKMASVGYRHYTVKNFSRIEKKDERTVVIHRTIPCVVENDPTH